MKAYVVGFLFDPDYKQIALIKKKRPPWQKGFFNGIGGHIEDLETPYQAMIREFKEEAGVTVKDWTHTITLIGEDWIVYFFKAIADVDLCTTQTDEQIRILSPKSFNTFKVLPNLKWMVPMQMENLHWPVTIYDMQNVEMK